MGSKTLPNRFIVYEFGRDDIYICPLFIIPGGITSGNMNLRILRIRLYIISLIPFITGRAPCRKHDGGLCPVTRRVKNKQKIHSSEKTIREGGKSIQFESLKTQNTRVRFKPWLSLSILVLSRALSLGGEGLRRLSLHAELRLLACARGGPHALNRRTSVLPAS